MQVFDGATGGFLAAWPVGGAPGGIGASADGSRVYVADAEARTVTVLDAAGTVVASWGAAGTTGPGGRAHEATIAFVTPTGVDVLDADDGAPRRIYVADPGAQRVWLLEPDGRVRDTIDRQTSTPLYDAPRDVVVDDGGQRVLTTTFRRLYGFRQGRLLRLPLPGPCLYGGVGLVLAPNDGLVATVQDGRAAWTGVLRYGDRDLIGVSSPEDRWGNLPPALGAFQGARRVAAALGVGAGEAMGDSPPSGAWLLDRWPRLQRWGAVGSPGGQWAVPEMVDIAVGGPADPADPAGDAWPGGPRGAWLVAPERLLRLGPDGALATRWRGGGNGPASGEAGAASDGTWLVAGAVADDGTVAAADAGRTRLLQWAPGGGSSASETGLGGTVVDLAPAAEGWWAADRSARALRRLDRVGRELGRIALPVRVDRLAADPAGTRLALLGDDGWVRVLDVAAGDVPAAPAPPGAEVAIPASLVAAFVGAPGGVAVDLDVDATGRVLVADGAGEEAWAGSRGRGVFGDDGTSGRLFWWGPDPDPNASPVAPPAGDDRCALRPDKRAAPSAVRVGEPVTVTLSLAGDCPSESAVLDIVLALDRSGSMEGPKLAAARAAAVAFGAELDFTRVQVAVLPFAGEAELALGLSADRAAAVRAVAGIAAGGGTDIAAALRAARAELTGPRARPESAPVILLMTDGLPESPEAARDAAAAARSAGATIYAIGLGDDVDVALLAELTGVSDQVFAVPNEAELARVYTRIARRLATSTLLRTITVEDEIPADMDYVPGSAEPPAAEFAPDRGAGRGRLLRWTLTDVLPAGFRLRYRLLPRSAGLRPTNVLAVGDYEDGIGFAGRVTFPVPRVRVAGDRQVWLPYAVQNRCPARRVDVVVALDASSSMLAPAEVGGAPGSHEEDAGTKLAAARAAARAFVDYLALPQDRTAVVAFDAEARILSPLRGDQAALERAIDGIRAGQGTRIDRGLAAAAATLAAGRRTGAVPVVVLLTDGRPASGSADGALAEAERLRVAGATIFTIGLGADVDGGFLVALAAAPLPLRADRGRPLRHLPPSRAGPALRLGHVFGPELRLPGTTVSRSTRRRARRFERRPRPRPASASSSASG